VTCSQLLQIKPAAMERVATVPCEAMEGAHAVMVLGRLIMT
jgi:hypothetical protein